ncbi:hypothetical protein BC938DRAFT_479046 [Jimgerdemannia flammicorona]|uniref:Uncharacterized protein n=1 Tax=Jimgerdemannia flammicorona TaxID=994334 RepID=A0A433QLR2_9FUNG|nr:hypothetical protein BC938DRAFT_479046 [Jimgerdemannia flammicorona]
MCLLCSVEYPAIVFLSEVLTCRRLRHDASGSFAGAHEVYPTLLQLTYQADPCFIWEMRHAGVLGLKYFFATLFGNLVKGTACAATVRTSVPLAQLLCCPSQPTGPTEHTRRMIETLGVFMDETGRVGYTQFTSPHLDSTRCSAKKL